MHDPARLHLLTPGADTGEPRAWYYEATETEDVMAPGFFSGAPIRPGASIFITTPSTARLYWMSREGVKLHPLDTIISLLAVDAVRGLVCGPREAFPLEQFTER